MYALYSLYIIDKIYSSMIRLFRARFPNTKVGFGDGYFVSNKVTQYFNTTVEYALKSVDSIVND